MSTTLKTINNKLHDIYEGPSKILETSFFHVRPDTGNIHGIFYALPSNSIIRMITAQ